MDFGDAFKLLQDGERIRMSEWSPGNFLMKRRISPGMAIVELYLDNATRRVTWSPTQREIMSPTWESAPAPRPKVVRVEGTDFFRTKDEK